MSPAGPGPQRRHADAPHLIVLCVDALRADSLTRPPGSIWPEAGVPFTPALDDLAASSRSWRRAFASSSWTKPAVPSIFLSMHPSEHGVFEVEKSGRRGARSTCLPEGARTIAEIAHDAGYRTIGLAHNAQLDPALGFGRGFDTFACDAGDGQTIAARLEGLTPFRGRSPALLYVHMIEPHWPYGGRIAARAEDVAVGRFPFHRFRASQWKALKADLKEGRARLTQAEIRFLRSVYRLAVEEADRAVGRLLVWLESEGVLRRAVVLLLADHGEELLDHGLIGHGQSLHDELLRVPFLLRVGEDVPDARFAGAGVSEATVSHVDVVPTLARLAGIPLEHASSGRDLLHPEALPRFVFSEVKHKRRYEQSVTDGRWKLIRRHRFRRPPDGEGASDYNNLGQLFAGRPFKLEQRLFDLESDPGEQHDLAVGFPETARLGAALDRWWSDLARHGGDSHAIEEDMIRRLEALGYL